MDDLATDIRRYLKNVSAVTTLVGSGTAARIYEEDAKQGQALPYLVFFITPGDSYENLVSIDGIATHRVTVMAYAATRAAAFSLQEAVRLAPLQHFRGTLGNRFVNSISSTGSEDYGRDEPTRGSNQRRYWCARDYVITHAEDTS